MLTENIARDTAFLVSAFMAHIIKNSTKDTNTIDVEQFKRARNLWHCTKTEFEREEVSRNIAIDLEATPDDGIVQAIFRHQFSKRLKENDDFAFDVEQILYVQNFRTPIEIPRDRVTSQSNKSKTQVHIQIGASQDSPNSAPVNLTHLTSHDTQNAENAA